MRRETSALATLDVTHGSGDARYGAGEFRSGVLHGELHYPVRFRRSVARNPVGQPLALVRMLALAEVEQLWGARLGTREGDRLDVLATLIDAYADGELDPAARAAVESAMREDPQIEKRVAEHRLLRQRINAAYSAELSEGVPERLLTAALLNWNMKGSTASIA